MTLSPPTTFTHRGKVIATVLSKAQGSELPPDLRAHCAFLLAVRLAKHSDAIKAIIAHGLAKDMAEADGLIAEGEDLENRR